MQRELILQRLREKGFRITKQRKMILDIILQEECSSCKEIYYIASAKDPEIGAATVYRMVNVLEEIGEINRSNMYKVSCGDSCKREDACVIELDDHTIHKLSGEEWHNIILAGLKASGIVDNQKIVSVMVEPCNHQTC